MTPVYHAEVKGGRILFFNDQSFKRLVHSMEGKRIEVVLREHKSKRSNDQNRLYWGVYLPILAEHIGYTSEEMHEALKLRFLFSHTDSAFPTVRSTASLNTKEFTAYLDQLDQLAAELGLYIPRAGEYEL